jgi:hypothetical protein
MFSIQECSAKIMGTETTHDASSAASSDGMHPFAADG